MNAICRYRCITASPSAIRAAICGRFRSSNEKFRQRLSPRAPSPVSRSRADCVSGKQATRQPPGASAEEVLIIGSTLVGANEITRGLIRLKRAAFGYHRLSWGQFASTLARPLLTVQRTVPLGGLGVQAVANRAIHKLAQAGGLGPYADLTSGPGFGRAIASVVAELRLEQIEPDALTHLAPDVQIFASGVRT